MSQNNYTLSYTEIYKKKTNKDFYFGIDVYYKAIIEDFPMVIIDDQVTTMWSRPIWFHVYIRDQPYWLRKIFIIIL